MTDDPSRLATVEAALTFLRPDTTIGLGSGRAVFLLAKLIGERFGREAKFRAVVASPETGSLAADAGIDVIDLTADVRLDVAIDGADEIDPQLRLIKGAGAALVREKLVLAAAEQVIIMAQASKLSDYLGTSFTLPVEVIPFAWTQTQRRVAALIDDPALRSDADGAPVVTANGNYLLDGRIKEGADLEALALGLDTTLGVVDHGLFLDQADQVILGKPDGTITTLTR